MMVFEHREAHQSIFADILQELQGRVRYILYINIDYIYIYNIIIYDGGHT
jgi:hypothetical protein